MNDENPTPLGHVGAVVTVIDNISSVIILSLDPLSSQDNIWYCYEKFQPTPHMLNCRFDYWGPEDKILDTYYHGIQASN